MDDETKPKPPLPPTAEDLERVRALILERRNQFIAAALAGLGAATASCTQTAPTPCLSVVSAGQAGTGTRQGGIQGTAGRPTPCLSIAVIDGRTGTPGLLTVPVAGNAGNSGAAGKDAQDKQTLGAGHGAAGNGHKDEDAGM